MMTDVSLFFFTSTIGLILYMLLISNNEKRLKKLEDKDSKKDN